MEENEMNEILFNFLYKRGTKVRLIKYHADEHVHDMHDGLGGIVERVEPDMILMVRWYNGLRLPIKYGLDSWVKEGD